MAKATDLEQIEVFRRLHRQIGAQLQAVDQTAATRDVNQASLDYAEVRGSETNPDMVSPAECENTIVLLLQSMRRNTVRAIDDLREIKSRASNKNGVVHGPQTISQPAEAQAPPATQPVGFDEEEMEVVEE